MMRGCRRPRRAGLAFRSYVTPDLAPPLLVLHNGPVAGGYPMLQNNVRSCCVEAAGLHTAQDWLPDFRPTDEMVLADYATAAGFDPANPDQTDNGTDPSEYMRAWQTGALQAPKIAAWVQLDPGNATELMLGIEHFRAVLMCSELPDAADDAPGKWLLRQCSGPPSGGHGYVLNGYDANRPNVLFDTVTWGAWYEAGQDEAFTDFYGFAAYAALPEAWLKPGGAPKGIDQAKLLHDLQQIGAM